MPLLFILSIFFKYSIKLLSREEEEGVVLGPLGLHARLRLDLHKIRISTYKFLQKNITSPMTENTVTAILKVFSCCFGLTCTDTSEGKVCLANRYFLGQFGSFGCVVGVFLVLGIF